MLRSFRHSVRGKLLAAVIVTAFTALAVFAVAVMIYDLRTYEQSRVDDLDTLADVLGAASAPALAFNDAREAQANLSLLRVRPSIMAGALYDNAGALYAVYSAEPLNVASLPLPAAGSYLINRHRLVLSKAVFEKEERVGTLYLVAKYEAVDRLLDTGAIVGVVVVFSLLVAALISAWLARTLSKPIIDITTASKRVLEDRNFSVRVSKTSEDEIGYLVDTFNAMLEEVGRRSAALEEADRKKDRFLAVLSHELRNPLNPIRNAVAVLRLAKSDPAKVTWAGEVIDRQARVLSRLLDDLLDVARITQDKIELRLQVIDIASAVAMASETARAGFEANRQSFEIALPDAPIYVHADPTRLAQVLSNILNNAAKYTDQGGTVRLSVRRTGADVVVSIKDSGVGIAPEDLSSVFDMFNQVAAQSSRAGGGLGIGLALVRALIELHGGTVSARSPGLGQGSEFVVTLPTVPAPAPPLPLPGAAAHSESQRKGLRILVADDVVDSRQSLSLALQASGHSVCTAADGAEAIQAALTVRPDVAILDIGMPGLDGYEVARRIREFDGGRRVFLIALSGWGKREDIERAQAAGFDHHITKPADFAALMQRIDEISIAALHAS
ncbi:MAG: response regulator [Proteobacteria bacterium]|nr:response regulator [Burkholderiales bacterium]